MRILETRIEHDEPRYREVWGDDRGGIGKSAPADVYKVRVEMMMTGDELRRFMAVVRDEWDVAMPGAPEPTKARRAELAGEVVVAPSELGTRPASRLLGR